MVDFLRSNKKVIKISDCTAKYDVERFKKRLEEKVRLRAVLYAAVHLREFEISEHEQYEISKHFRAITNNLKMGLIVHRDPILAKSVGADAVHLQFQSLDVIKSEIPFGVSCHTIEEVVMAEQAGASYVYLSPIFTPLSKLFEGEPLGMEVLMEARAAVSIPVIALGGVTLKNLPELCPRPEDKGAGITIS